MKKEAVWRKKMPSCWPKGSVRARPIFFLSLFFLCLGTPSHAHRVNIFAWFDGEKVNGRAYYSRGIPVKAAEIEVLSMDGKRLCSLKTGNDGRFSFRPKGREALKIVLFAGPGHKATTVIRTGLYGKKGQKDSSINSHKWLSSIPKTTACDFSLEDIDGLLKRRLAPLEREMERLSIRSQEITLNDVISGLGYIMGIMGLWLYFLSKCQSKKAGNDA